jgi:RimJ/RimL family protein N-acetyltransferase
MDLKRFKRHDVPELLSWIENEAALTQWAGPLLAWPLTANRFCEHLQAADANPPTLYPFGLYAAGTLLGYCELSDHRQQADSAMLSRVVIRPDRRGQGLGQLMVRQALAFGFERLKLHRIGLAVFDFNEPAFQCYIGAGFTHEGTLRDSARVGDERWNCHIMSILCHEWDGGRTGHDAS